MHVFDLIKRRRSIGKMTGERPTREQIELLLEAATHAPNHHNAQPWKFIVLAGNAREELGTVMAMSLADRLEETSSEKAQAILNKERNKPLRSPVVIVVVAEAPKQPNVMEIENIEAASAAVQNMLLTAEEMGLACMWRTGDAAYDPHVKQWLGSGIRRTYCRFSLCWLPGHSSSRAHSHIHSRRRLPGQAGSNKHKDRL